jgi:hypothetical protein
VRALGVRGCCLGTRLPSRSRRHVALPACVPPRPPPPPSPLPRHAQISLPEFWREEMSPGDDGYAEFCPPQRTHRDTCPLVVACQPLYACAGNNKCNRGYDDQSPRCSKCAKQYYRYAAVLNRGPCAGATPVCVGEGV